MEVICLIFIILGKWKQPPTKEDRPLMGQFTKTVEELEKQGIKWRSYWTLGHYDAVAIVEAPSEKNVMKIMIPWQGRLETETMVAVPREEAIKLI